MEVAIQDLQQELKAANAEIVRLVNESKTATGARLDELSKKINDVQRQADAIDSSLADNHRGGGSREKSLAELIGEDESFTRVMHDGKGTAVLNLKGDQCRLLERKTLVSDSALGTSTSGVLQIERLPGITAEARQQLTLRNLLIARPTTQALIDFMKVNSPMSRGSLQVEGNAKLENAVTFNTASEKIQTVAHWLPITTQAASDAADLAAFINDSLLYYLDLTEEVGFLYGSGIGADLHGIVPQAAAFDYGLLDAVGGYTRIDIISAAMQLIAEAKEIPPTWVALNNRDWFKLRRTKDSMGRYILGDPNSPESRKIWELDVIPTQNIGVGEFLVGTGNPAAIEIRDRMEAQIEISNSHGTYFTENKLAVRAERRCALITRRPASFVYGSFTTSP